MNKTTITTFAVCAVMEFSAHAQNLLLNGSFELPAIPSNTFQRGTNTSWAWSGTAGFIINGNSGGGRPLPQDGQQFIDMGNSAAFVLSQNFSITTNGVFVLAWFDDTATPPSTSLYSVAVLDSSARTVVSTNLDASHAGQWQQRELHVGLSRGEYTLRFRAEGNGNSHDTLLDNASLELEQLPGKVVSGTIVGQVWTATNSPYRVVGDVQVAGLIVQPGVTVLMAGNYVFEVAGTLKAIGTVTAPILFSSTNGGWQGLFFNSAQAGCELAHCIIERSVNSGIRIGSSTPSISDSIFQNNTVSPAQGQNSSIEATGGGIKTDSPLVLDNCVIQNNSVVANVMANNATAITKGGGIYSTAPLTLLNCTVSSNSLSARCVSLNGKSVCEGAGVWAGTNLTVQSCIVEGNFADAESMAGGFSYATNLGAGIFSRGPSIHRNSILVRNTAIGSAGFPFNGGNLIVKGGGMYVAGSAQSVENSTIAFNNPDGLATDTNATQVLSSIVWGNVTNQIVGTTNVNYSDVQGAMAGVGNKNGNPIFLSSSDLIIVPGSPCINAGNTNAAYTNVFFPPSIGTIHNDMGAHGGPGAGARLRARFSQQMEVVFLGGVPGYNYQIEASTDLLNWQTVEPVQIAHLGDYASFLEPFTNNLPYLPYRFYRLNLGQ